MEQFDEELLGRLRVTPGITGLWQVEARDDPSFEAYRLYDMLYVDNWSFSLDLAIMAWTVLALVSRAVRILAPIGKTDQGPDRSECERLGCFDIATASDSILSRMPRRCVSRSKAWTAMSCRR